MNQYTSIHGFRFMHSERPGSSQQKSTASHREIPINPDELVPPPPPSLSGAGRQKSLYRTDTEDFYRDRSKEMMAPVQRNLYQREERPYQREERINEDRIMQEIFLLKKEMSRVSAELVAVKQQNESQEAVTSLKKDVSTLQGEMQMLIAGMSEISGKEDRFEKMLDKYSEKHDQLKNEIKFLDKEFKSMKESLKGLGKDFKALWIDTKSITAIHGDLIGLERKFESHKAMEARMVLKFKTMSKLKADVDHVSSDIYSLRESLNKKLEPFYELEKRMTKLSAVDHRVKRSTSPESFSFRLKKVEESFSKKITRIESYLDEIYRGKVKRLVNDSDNFSKEGMGAPEELPESTTDVPTERIVKLLDRKANQPAEAKPESNLKMVKNKANEPSAKEPANAVRMAKNNGTPAGEDMENIVKTVKRKANELVVEGTEMKKLKKQDQSEIHLKENVAVITNMEKPNQLTKVFKFKLLSKTKIQIFGKIGLCRKTLILPIEKVYCNQWLFDNLAISAGDIHCMLQSSKKGDEVVETVLFGWIGKKPLMLSSNSIVYAKTAVYSLGFELLNDKIAKVNFIIDKQPVWLELKVEMLSIGKKTCSNLNTIPKLAWNRIKYVLDLDEHCKPHIIKATLIEQEIQKEDSPSVLELARGSNSLTAEVMEDLNPDEMIVLDAIYEGEISQKDGCSSIEDEANLKDNIPSAAKSASPVKGSVLKNAKQTEVGAQEPHKWRPKSLDKSGDIFHSYVGAPQKYEDPADMEYVPHEKVAFESHPPAPSPDELSPELTSQSASTSDDVEIIEEIIAVKNIFSPKNLPGKEESEVSIIQNDFASEKSLVESAQNSFGGKVSYDTSPETTEKQSFKLVLGKKEDPQSDDTLVKATD